MRAIRRFQKGEEVRFLSIRETKPHYFTGTLDVMGQRQRIGFIAVSEAVSRPTLAQIRVVVIYRVARSNEDYEWFESKIKLKIQTMLEQRG